MALLVLSSAGLAADAQTRPSPYIDDISPSSASHGARITITGGSFDQEKNDIGFINTKQKDDNTYAGYLNNIPSPDGNTLVFELPQSVGACAFSVMQRGDVCIEIALLLEEGDYEVFVVNSNGKSNTQPFKIVSAEQEPKEQNYLSTIIQTKAGDLTLSYKDGVATLSGIIQRLTPCVDWHVEIVSTKDMPPSVVGFHIFNPNEGLPCVQVLGEPQQITATSQAGEHTHYTVMLENESVFSGTLVQTMGKQADIDVKMKIRKNFILLAFRNNDETPIYGIEISVSGGTLKSAKAKGWTGEKTFDNTVLLSTDKKPVAMNGKLLVKLRLDDPYVGIAWKAYDSNNNILASGAMIPARR